VERYYFLEAVDQRVHVYVLDDVDVYASLLGICERIANVATKLLISLVIHFPQIIQNVIQPSNIGLEFTVEWFQMFVASFGIIALIFVGLLLVDE